MGRKKGKNIAREIGWLGLRKINKDSPKRNMFRV